MSIVFPELLSARLRLREIHMRDAIFIHFMRSDPGVNAFINRTITKNVEDAKVFIAARLEDNRMQRAFYWTICDKANDEFMGSICIWNINNDTKSGEVGYDLHPRHHRKGFMSEAIMEVLDYGFGKIGLEKVVGITSRENIPSQQLMEKVGFSKTDQVLSPKDKENHLIGYEISG